LSSTAALTLTVLVQPATRMRPRNTNAKRSRTYSFSSGTSAEVRSAMKNHIMMLPNSMLRRAQQLFQLNGTGG